MHLRGVLCEALGCKHMTQFNGWQRLWVFVSGSYLLAVLVIAFSSLPAKSDVSSTDILSQVSDQSLQSMANAREKWNTIVEDGISIPVPLGLDQAETQTFKADYKRAVEAATHKKRIGHLVQLAVLWLIPSVLLYVFGLGIAWIRRGFKRGAP